MSPNFLDENEIAAIHSMKNKTFVLRLFPGFGGAKEVITDLKFHCCCSLMHNGPQDVIVTLLTAPPVKIFLLNTSVGSSARVEGVGWVEVSPLGQHCYPRYWFWLRKRVSDFRALVKNSKLFNITTTRVRSMTIDHGLHTWQLATNKFKNIVGI